MTDLILVRLHPGEQTDPNTFTQALQGLQITAYDLTVANPGQPVQIGTASGLAAPAKVKSDSGGGIGGIGGGGVGTTVEGGTVDLSSVQIIQHWKQYTDVLDQKVQLESAATAVIVASAPTGHPEYPTADSFDVQLAITRNGVPIADAVIEYNAAVVQVSGAPSTDQTFYFNPPSPGAAAYVTIPPAPPAGAQPPALLLKSDSTPSPFDDLKTAIDGVLADDPSGTNLVEYTLNNKDSNGKPQPLSAAQCQQIAAEIIYNRGYSPAPSEPSDYGLLYTSDPDSALGVNTQDEDTARQKFEGQVTAYHATNDALATRLAGYVYTASAAVLCEQQSATAPSAGFPFPLITGTGPVIDTEVELQSIAPASFAVPAAYFYALATTLSPQITSDQRRQLAVYAPEDKNLTDLAAAVSANVVGSTEKFVTLGSSPPAAININQAARRLNSLSVISGSLPAVINDTHVAELVNGWLAWTGDTSTIDADFWPGEVGAAATAAHQADYLNLVLQVVTGQPSSDPSFSFSSFLSAIQAQPLAIDSVSKLADTSDQAWQTFFLANTGQLPPFTAPGTTVERIAAFIRHLQKFFTTPVGPVSPSLQSPGGPGVLGTPTNDVLGQFEQNYANEGGGTFAFGGAWDSTALAAAVAGTLPGDTAAQAWLTQALNTIEALYEMTAFATGSLSELRFSLMEALYARGFTTKASVQALTPGDFQSALDGTVAYPYATQIQTAAGGSTAPATSQGSGFLPVNPDGSLTNCVPPPHLSPFGPVAYLSQMLLASAASTCEQPKGTDVTQQIGALLKTRRGPLGNLHATRANLDTPLPALDLVNESLEALAAAVAGGASATAARSSTPTAASSTRRMPSPPSPSIPRPRRWTARLPNPPPTRRCAPTSPHRCCPTTSRWTSAAATCAGWRLAGSRRCGGSVRTSPSSCSIRRRPTSRPPSSATGGATRSASRRRWSTWASPRRSTPCSTGSPWRPSRARAGWFSGRCTGSPPPGWATSRG